MPTNKPKVQIILDEEMYKKLKEIAEKDKRSISQMGGIIIEKYIEEHESKLKKG
jgi:predicted DNA-binding protein